MNRFGFVKVAAAVPHVALADCERNADRIMALAARAAEAGVAITVFPELSVTGYTCGDLFQRPTLLRAAERALCRIVEESESLPTALIIGMPVEVGHSLYNCAVVVARGEIMGVVPKCNIPDYGEFYEARWFRSGFDVHRCQIELCSHSVPFGSDLLFSYNGCEFGVEICEDLWVAAPPSSHQAMAGAKVIFNLSASPESVGKNAYLRQLVKSQSARTLTAYVYASAGRGESSTDLVFAGNAMIAEDGIMLACSERFSQDEMFVTADIDLEYLQSERLRRNTFEGQETSFSFSSLETTDTRDIPFERTIDPQPFVPQNAEARREACREIMNIQVAGLVQRLRHTSARTAVVGISGGLDSTLALLVAVAAADTMGLARASVTGVTMPGFGTTDRTYHNALALMRSLGVTVREIPIRKACEQHFADIGLDAADRSAAYENAQARERTQILMDIANMEGGLVIGTGDLSELALGWATYNGDQMSMYGVNASVPKTLVRSVVETYAESADAETARILRDIVDTPVSPELLPADANGDTTQRTEDIVGPYELHDFFLYNMLRCGFAPDKILFLATRAFDGRYDRSTIHRWLTTFLRRFFSQQFKRSAMPDGPKVGSVALSPRGDWRMPSDALAGEWLRRLENEI